MKEQFLELEPVGSHDSNPFAPARQAMTYSTATWTCDTCGAKVERGVYHVCGNNDWRWCPVCGRWKVIGHVCGDELPRDTDMSRIATALERIADAMVRMGKE